MLVWRTGDENNILNKKPNSEELLQQRVKRLERICIFLSIAILLLGFSDIRFVWTTIRDLNYVIAQTDKIVAQTDTIIAQNNIIREQKAEIKQKSADAEEGRKNLSEIYRYTFVLYSLVFVDWLPVLEFPYFMAMYPVDI